MLEVEFVEKEVIILAENFNPSIFSSHWLIKHGFVKEDDILANSIFTSNAVQLKTNDFTLSILPEQLIYSIKVIEKQSDLLINIVKKLPEIPYKAVGVNFNWIAYDKNKNISQLSKDIFFMSQLEVFKYFDETPNSRYGVYLSKDHQNSRLRLNILPSIYNDKCECFHFSFNFHQDLAENNATIELLSSLKEIPNYYLEAKKIVGLL